MPSTTRQNVCAITRNRIASRRNRITDWSTRHRTGLLGRGNSFEPALRRLRFRTVRRKFDDLLPRLGRAGQILLAERQDDALVQQRLRVVRIDPQRVLELLQRFVGSGSCSSS